MVDRFVPCVSCARHVKAGDRACPFCGAVTPETTTPIATINHPISRAAVLFVGLTTAACGGAETSSTSSSSTSGSSSSSGSESSSTSSSGNPDPEPTVHPVPVYGPAPSPTHTTSGGVPVYGPAPVPLDAGKN